MITTALLWFVLELYNHQFHIELDVTGEPAYVWVIAE